jgi:hypothetical protein
MLRGIRRTRVNLGAVVHDLLNVSGISRCFFWSQLSAALPISECIPILSVSGSRIKRMYRA